MKYEVFDLFHDLDKPIATIKISDRGAVTCTSPSLDKMLNDVFVDGCDRTSGPKFMRSLPLFFAGSALSLRIVE